MRPQATLGVDVGTSSTKGVLVDAEGTVLRSATREHAVTRLPDREVRNQYDELYSLYRELYTSTAATVHALAAREQRATGTTTEEPR